MDEIETGRRDGDGERRKKWSVSRRKSREHFRANGDEESASLSRDCEPRSVAPWNRRSPLQITRHSLRKWETISQKKEREKRNFFVGSLFDELFDEKLLTILWTYFKIWNFVCFDKVLSLFFFFFQKMILRHFTC